MQHLKQETLEVNLLQAIEKAAEYLRQRQKPQQQRRRHTAKPVSPDPLFISGVRWHLQCEPARAASYHFATK